MMRRRTGGPANLDGADRWLLAHKEVRAHVRYMDDVLWWCDEREQAKQVLHALRTYLANQWRLDLKANARIWRSARGVAFCGFRVKPGIILPSARKLKRYRAGCKALDRAIDAGQATTMQAQRAHDMLAATLAHTQSLRFRQRLCSRSGAYNRAL